MSLLGNRLKGRKVRSPCGQVEQRVEVDLEVGDPLADAVGVEHARVDLADGADRARRPRGSGPPASGGSPGTSPFSMRAPVDGELLGDELPQVHGLGRVAPGQHGTEALALVGEVGVRGRRAG